MPPRFRCQGSIGARVMSLVLVLGWSESIQVLLGCEAGRSGSYKPPPESDCRNKKCLGRPHMVSLIGCPACSGLCVGDAWAFSPTAATVVVVFVAVVVSEPLVLGRAQRSQRQHGVGGGTRQGG